MSRATNPVGAYLSTLQDMAHSTDIPDTDGASATTFNSNM